MAKRTFSTWAMAAGLAGAVHWSVRSVLRRRRRLQLHGAKVLITGGSRGLGFAAARRFVREGSDVAICARDQQELERAAHELRRVAEQSAINGDVPSIVALRCDVTDEASTGWLVDEARAALGGIDVLVNCAVEIAVGPLEAMTGNDFESAFRGIFAALYQPTMAVVPFFRAQRAGRIVNVTSVAGKLPIPHNATYSVGKFATTAFSALCAIELRKYGIRVSTVMPPPLRNGAWMNASYKGDDDEELAWFARALCSPLVSIDPERAARAIVTAARFGDVESMVAPSSWLQSRLYGLFPAFVTSFLAWLDQHRMPKPPLGARAASVTSAAEILSTSENPRVHRAARRGKPAGDRYLQPVAARMDERGRIPSR